MRAAFRELILTTPGLLAVVPAARVLDIGSAIDKPEPPYIVLAWQPQLATASGRYKTPVNINVHDVRGSYVQILDIRKIIDAHLTEAAQFAGSDGVITQADYSGDGGDQFDPDTATNVQWSTWILVGRST